jgi:hypothetical protein
MPARECLGQSCIIPRQAAKPCGLGVTPLHPPPAWQQHTAFFCCGQLDPRQMPVLGVCVLRSLGPRIPLVHTGPYNGVASNLVPRGGPPGDLRAVLLVGGGDVSSQQRPQGIDRRLPLRAPTAFGPLIAGTGPACGGRLQRPAIADGCRGFCMAPLRQPHHRTQVVHDGVKDARPDEPAQAVKDLAQAMLPAGAPLRSCRSNRGSQGPIPHR